jgi:hypothetical protein
MDVRHNPRPGGTGSPRAAICAASRDGPVITRARARPAPVTVKPCGWSRGTKTKLPGPTAQRRPLFARGHLLDFCYALFYALLVIPLVVLLGAG